MPDGDQNLAQAFYLAQLYAARGTCKCKACQLLRKVSEEMTEQMIGSSGGTRTRGGRGKTSVPGLTIPGQGLTESEEE